MATIAALPQQTTRQTSGRAARTWHGLLPAAVLTPVLLPVHGYHPFAEDGGIYVCSIKHLLDPSLYPFYTGFVSVHERLQVFPHLVVKLVQVSSIGLPYLLLPLHLLSIFLTLLAAWAIALRIFESRTQCLAAVAIFGSLLTLPVAGTSLALVDPYVTARSFVLPCVLFGLAFALDLWRRPARPGSLLALGLVSCAAVLLHPLMAGYGMATTLCVLSCALPAGRKRAIAWSALCAAALLAVAAALRFAPVEPAGYAEVAHTRAYWFLSQWRWYEVVGLLAPLAILCGFALRSLHRNARLLAGGALLSGCLGLAVSLLCVHVHSASFAVARLQPLRVFQSVYAVMLLLLGGWVATLPVFRSLPRIAAGCALLCTLMFAVQRGIYPQSAIVELPWATSKNDWVSAFVWVREHTPHDTLLALDTHYIGTPGEDTQNAKAISERSVLPDFSKDGGIAAIAPALTKEWTTAQQLNGAAGPLTGARIHALAALHLGWIILPAFSQAPLDCPYRNSQVKVCSLPRR